jgi:hypothetical protein
MGWVVKGDVSLNLGENGMGCQGLRQFEPVRGWDVLSMDVILNLFEGGMSCQW